MLLPSTAPFTKLFAPITAPSLILAPFKIVQFAAIQQSFPMLIGDTVLFDYLHPSHDPYLLNSIVQQFGYRLRQLLPPEFRGVYNRIIAYIDIIPDFYSSVSEKHNTGI